MDTIKWLLPNVTVPTWMDIMIAMAICLIGWLFQQFVLKKNNNGHGCIFEKKDSVTFKQQCWNNLIKRYVMLSCQPLLYLA